MKRRPLALEAARRGEESIGGFEFSSFFFREWGKGERRRFFFFDSIPCFSHNFSVSIFPFPFRLLSSKVSRHADDRVLPQL